MVMAGDGMVRSPAPPIVYSSAVPEQDSPPPRRLARPYRPGRDDEEPPPWANMPPVRPAGRSGGHRRPEDPEDGFRGQQPEDDAEEAFPPSPAREPRRPGGRALRAAARRRRRW